MRVTITVPATSANLGPGFDIFGLALQLQNEVEAILTDDGAVTVSVDRDAPPELRDPATNLVARAYRSACAQLGVAMPSARLTCVNRIPLRRGLGSSAAAALAGTLAACALHAGPWDEEQILAHVTEFEGHRDNAAAALLGGLTICAPGVPAVTMEVPDELRVVVFVPDVELATATARGVIGDSFTRADAVYNAARCALLVRAIATSDFQLLGAAMQDRWHQRQRTVLFPALPVLIEAAMEGGAYGAALSGAGPSVIALVSAASADAVGAAMERAASAGGVGGHAIVTAVRTWGARVDVHAS